MPKSARLLATGACITAAVLSPSSRLLADSEQATVDAAGTTHVPAYSLPESSLLGADARTALRKERMRQSQLAGAADTCPSEVGADAAHMPQIRKCEMDAFYRSADYKHLRSLYHVDMSPQTIGGVYTEVFTPTGGVSPDNLARVLINVHGGGFRAGARTESHLESVPIAALGKIRVISIDYRQAPEYAFPAATEDVAKVYREVLKTYKRENIGLYGCSAGGLLTAESVAWFLKENIPLPGAVGMLCAGAAYWSEGDSGEISTAHGWWRWGPGDTVSANPYFKTTNADDPLAFPVRSASVMAKFPPSLLIAGTRDVALSSVVYTHAVLVAQGVDAELHVWEGLQHGFILDPDLPQSREVYSVIVKFFDAHLGH